MAVAVGRSSDNRAAARRSGRATDEGDASPSQGAAIRHAYGLRNSLPGYEVKTAYQMGWADLSNGDLLREAEVARFAAMVTCDRNIRYQQNMAARQMALVVLTTNNWDLLKANLDRIRDAIAQIGPGTFETLDFGLPPRRQPRPPAEMP
jgi:hypothetical protein